jgi:predicted HNH restriction endonuclease
MASAQSGRGSELNERWGIGAKHPLYRKNGTWYHNLMYFPGALIDESGFILFKTKRRYVNNPGLHIRARTTIRDGISTLPGYVWVRKAVGAGGQSSAPAETTAALEGIRREVVYYSRSRSRPLRNTALIRSKGVCEVCRRDFSRVLRGLGLSALQVHHRKQLSVSDVPQVNRLSDLAVVCATCHALIHSNPKKAIPVAVLKRKLKSSRSRAG